LTYLESALLGLVQGLTEFLPVSSSGHIQLGEALLGVENEESLRFTIIVHAATMLSTVVVFHRDIAGIFQGLWKRNPQEWRFAGQVLISLIPALFVYLFFKEQLEGLFGDNLRFVGACLLVTAGLLMLTSVARSGDKPLSYGRAALIGTAQALAMLPGVSRSGATISTALYLGVDKTRATQFSFLMVIPLILGGTLLDLKTMIEEPHSAAADPAVLGVGFLAAFLAGLFACRAMIGIVRRGKLWYFALYCALAGTLALVLG
jgi:undecaprenyl-diphosphatase